MKPESHLPPAEYAAEHPVLANPGETRALDHLPQLDGVRAIAVLLVLWFHFTPNSMKIAGGPPWGAIGVGLFFTLSGFLITRILLKCRLQIIAGAGGFGQMMKQFYMRRFLRIFPLYYAVLAILFVFNPTKFRHRAVWNLLYLTNYRFSYWPHKGTDEIERHLWSLSVEEQFYLIWPLLMLVTPRKLLGPLIVLTIFVAPYWRYKTYVVGLLAHEWMMPGCLDLLAGGALLAFLSLPQFGWSRFRDAYVQLCGLIGLPLLIAYVGQRLHPTLIDHKWVASGFDAPAWGGIIYALTAMASVWFIGTAAKGFRGPIGWFLTSAPIVYIGRISYGLYVIHMFVPHLMGYFFPASYGDRPRTWGSLLLFTGISIALASVSWFAFEAPINRLKRYFEYDKTAAAKAATSA